jgi:tripartite-type tricarboxylate transporter receptor subunit TctC
MTSSSIDPREIVILSGPSPDLKLGLCGGCRCGPDLLGFISAYRGVDMQCRDNIHMVRVMVTCAGVLVAALTGTVSAMAQDWPARPIHLLVGFGAGGGTDIAARIIADPLGEMLGQTVVVENRVSAGGVIAANAVAKAPKDGYLALMMSNAHVITPVMYKSLPYDSVNDFRMISMVGSAGLILVARPDFPANNLGEVLNELKAHPGKYNFASPGVGTTQHFAVELMEQMAGVKMQHIPFRGTPAATAALIGKQVDLMIELIQTVKEPVASGALKAIAVTSPQRFPSVPTVPTFIESGMPGYAVTSWYGLALTAGTPEPIVTKVTDALHKVLERPAVRDQITKVGALPKSSTAEELRDLISSEIERWQKVREQAGIPQQ